MCWHIHMAFKWEITWNMGPRVGSQPPYVLWWVQRVLKFVAAVTAGEWGWYSTGWKSLTEKEGRQEIWTTHKVFSYLSAPEISGTVEKPGLSAVEWFAASCCKTIITSEQIYASFIMHNKLRVKPSPARRICRGCCATCGEGVSGAGASCGLSALLEGHVRTAHATAGAQADKRDVRELFWVAQ